MSTTLLDVEAVRARASRRSHRPLAFFDGPGGTQCPDEVIDAIAGLPAARRTPTSARRTSTSIRTDELVERAARDRRALPRLHRRARSIFGPSMTNAQLPAHADARATTPAAGDEILVTKLDHDANVSPWLELERDLGLVVRFVDVHDELTLDLDDLERQLTDRTRVVAFPIASNAVGTTPDVARIVELAHGAGALAWADAVHYGPHGPIDVAGWGVDVLLCSPYKFFGPHMGLAFGKRGAARVVAALQGAAVSGRAASAAASRRARSSTSCSPASSPAWSTSSRSAGTRSSGTSATSVDRFLDGLPDGVELYGLPHDGGPRVHLLLQPARHGRPSRWRPSWPRARSPSGTATTTRSRSMRRLGLAETGAVRAGIVHYNTAERGRPPARRARGAVRVLVLGGTKFLGRAIVEAALARGHEVTLFNRGETNPELFPEAEQLRGDRTARPLRARGPLAGTPCSTRRATCRRSCAPRPSCSATSGQYVVRVEHLGVRGLRRALGRSRADRRAGRRAGRRARLGLLELRPAEGAVRGRGRGRLRRTAPLIVRPGLIVGPHDPTGRFTYWPHRLARGGELLAPGPPERRRPVRRRPRPRRVDDRGGRARPERGLQRHERGHPVGRAAGGSQRHLGAGRVPAGARGGRVDGAAALDRRHRTARRRRPDLAEGLRTRPLADTLAGAAGAPDVDGVGLTPEREAELLAAWHERPA